MSFNGTGAFPPSGPGVWTSPPETPALAGQDVHVWRIDLDAGSSEPPARVLSADELARAGRFKFPRDREHFVEARAALRRILDLFDSKYWLAEPGTRAFYQSYYDFVEYWNRVKHGALPVEVRKYVPQDEDGFAKFLDHLESTLQALQNELRSRKSGSGKWGLTFGGRSS